MAEPATGFIEKRCPVCRYVRAVGVRLAPAEYITGGAAVLPEVREHIKYICCRCGHYYSDWLDGNVVNIADKYNDRYENEQSLQENERIAFQRQLLEQALLRLNRDTARVLDFGCGGNFRAAQEMHAQGKNTYCCDILDGLPYDHEGFFKLSYNIKDHRGFFDAVVSIDVIEHLGDTFKSWAYLNRILRPKSIMLHCFPTLLHYATDHPYFQDPFHVCIFSGTSLSILCERTGFSLVGVESFPADVPHLFVFQKNRELE